MANAKLDEAIRRAREKDAAAKRQELEDLKPFEERLAEQLDPRPPAPSQLELGLPGARTPFVPEPACIPGCARRGYHLVSCPAYRRRTP